MNLVELWLAGTVQEKKRISFMKLLKIRCAGNLQLSGLDSWKDTAVAFY